MIRNLVQNNIPLYSILLFIIFYGGILSVKPSFLYNKNGSLRDFGIGFSKKTILPAWLFSILLSIVAYFLIFYYASFSHV
jgi:hypothetical protein